MFAPFIPVQGLLRSLGRAVVHQTRLPIGRAPLIHARGQIRPFTLDRPATVRDASRGLVRRLDVRAMAGGIDLINEMKVGAEVGHVVHLGAVPGLNRIAITRNYLSIGATATHAQIECNADVAAALPALPHIVRDIANVRVRAVGTIGGNIMIASRYYDWLPILMALGAEISFEDREDRWQPVERLATPDGLWMMPKRLLRDIRIPLWGKPALHVNRTLKPAISIAICVRTGAERRSGRVAVACTCAAPVVRDIVGFDERDISVSPDAVAQLVGPQTAAAFPKPHDDGLAGTPYRQAMTRTLITRVLTEALKTA